MPTRIRIVNGIIITITIKIETVDIFGIEVCCIIRGDKSSKFRRVITRIEVIEVVFNIEVIASISDGVIVCEGVV